MTRIEELVSPNNDARPPGATVDILVIHYTGMTSGGLALQRLRDASAKVSAHYLIEEDGRIFRLVPEERRAWHAGVAHWRGHSDINSRSIGIELVNPGHEFGYRAFAMAQMNALVTLAKDIVRRRKIPARNVVGHSDVAPERKEDPGELFDWAKLAKAGIGLFPRAGARPQRIHFAAGARDKAITAVQANLASWGYDLPATGTLDPRTMRVLTAFQRHFRPSNIDGTLDGETAGRLADLLDQAG